MRMFEIAVGDTNCDLSQKDFKALAELSEGYSGSDISIAVQDALMQPVRKIQMATHYKKVTHPDVQSEMQLCLTNLIRPGPGQRRREAHPLLPWRQGRHGDDLG